MLVLQVIFNSTGNVLLAKGMHEIGELRDWSFRPAGLYLVSTLTSAWVLLGMCALLLSFVFWLVVVSWADYSYVSPATATGYALVALQGHFLLGEAVPWLHWVGVAFICMGVAMAGRTSPTTTGQD